MKKYILLFALAAFAFASCSKDDQTPEEKVSLKKYILPDIIYAGTETNTQTGTKTYWGNNLKVLWNANDLISMFGYNPTNVKYRFLGADGDASGEFEIMGEKNDQELFNAIWAVYPYSSDITINSSGTEISLNLPADQTYRANSFGPGANTMVAVREPILLGDEDSDYEFKNACGYLRLKLYGEGVSVSSITLEGKNGEKIAGAATIAQAIGGLPTVTMGSGATTKIKINCPTPVTLGTSAEDATEFNFVIPPVTFTNGFKITIDGTSGGKRGRKVKSTSANIQIERNVRRNMAALSVALEPLELVEFEDETFKAYCVANFDTDGDGEISIDEALAVTVMNCFNASSTHEYTYYYSGDNRYDFIYASSLKGIEEFKNLQILNVSGSTAVQGPLASLDLRQNTALKLLIVNFNDITSLNIEGLTQLEGLECCYTKLPEIDAYGLSSLQDLNATNNTLLKKINISQCTSFTTLDIANTLNLEHFECAKTKLTKLNLSYQPHLSYVNCSYCSVLEELDLSESKVSNSITWANCPAMKRFLFSNTELATWPAEDFAGFSYLEEVDLNGSNYAGTLDLSDKGHLKKLDAGNNQLLTGITVAERAPIEDFACANSGVTSLDIERLSLLNNFNCANCEDLESLTVKNCKISNSVAWTGCDELKTLNLYGTEIISWPAGDFNVFPALEDLNISYTNYVYALDMSCNGGLKYLECEKAGISSINVSGLPELVFINCSKNSGLTSLNLSGLARLKALDCRECGISTLNLTGCSALFNLYCAQNNIETLDLQPCTSLEELYCSQNKLEALDLQYSTLLRLFDCSQNKIGSLNLSACTSLREIDCSLNKIETLDIHYCSLLNALKAWPQSDNYSLHMIILTTAQINNIDGSLKLYDTSGAKTYDQIVELYNTIFTNSN
ncbi:MAG: hypothetical protein IJK74_08810 [Bacteroidales bacterium]|nr:hypothetical protein [Bacteroidales bacterium]